MLALGASYACGQAARAVGGREAGKVQWLPGWTCLRGRCCMRGRDGARCTCPCQGGVGAPAVWPSGQAHVRATSTAASLIPQAAGGACREHGWGEYVCGALYRAILAPQLVHAIAEGCLDRRQLIKGTPLPPPTHTQSTHPVPRPSFSLAATAPAAAARAAGGPGGGVPGAGGGRAHGRGRGAPLAAQPQVKGRSGPGRGRGQGGADARSPWAGLPCRHMPFP